MQISPGIAHPPSRLCLSDLRRSVPYKFRALMISDISPRYAASYPLPVRQASALPSASSRFPVTRNTLAVRLTLPLVGRVEDFHLQVSAPCRAHQIKNPQVFTWGFFVCKESDDDLLWFRHHIDEADMSLRRNKRLRRVLSLRSSRSQIKFHKAKSPTISGRAFLFMGV